jgi:HSP20 family protein
MFFNRNVMLMPELFRRDLGDWLENVVDNATNRTKAFPALNIWEDGDNLNAEAELPGLTMDQVEVYVVGNELTIRGQRHATADAKHEFHRRERGAGEFARTVTLPFEIDAQKVEATLRNGILNITLPKAEAAKPRKIAVKA